MNKEISKIIVFMVAVKACFDRILNMIPMVDKTMMAIKNRVSPIFVKIIIPKMIKQILVISEANEIVFSKEHLLQFKNKAALKAKK